MNRLDLMKMALAALGDMGDIFTDAPESAASVAAAQNLQKLAGILSGQSSLVGRGKLEADGEAVCDVNVYLAGTLVGNIPDGFDTSGRAWTVTLKSGNTLRVAMFAGQSSDDEAWVIDDPEAFYAALLEPTPQ